MPTPNCTVSRTVSRHAQFSSLTIPFSLFYLLVSLLCDISALVATVAVCLTGLHRRNALQARGSFHPILSWGSG